MVHIKSEGFIFKTKALAELISLVGPVQHAHTNAQKRSGRVSHFHDEGVGGVDFVGRPRPARGHTRPDAHWKNFTLSRRRG